jgi:peptide/nickel transport system ATP-binding protein
VGRLPQVPVDNLSHPKVGGNALVSLENIEVVFNQIGPNKSKIKAVDNVSIELLQNEILSLVGESGSGKTTLAKCIAGLNGLTSGSIFFQGTSIRDLLKRSPYQYWKDVQVIFQDPYESLNPRQNVYSIVATPIRRLLMVRDETLIRERVMKILEEVGLQPDYVVYKYPHELSGGERQRVSIARAIAPDPKLLIADEPITMLDASQRMKMLALILRMKRERNLSIILVTHDLASAHAIGDRTAIMYRGKLVEVGPTEQVLSRPLHPYTKLILDSMPKLKGPLNELGDGGGTSPSLPSDIENIGCAFRSRCAYATRICAEVEPKLEEKANSQHAACHNPLNG